MLLASVFFFFDELDFIFKLNFKIQRDILEINNPKS